MANTDKLPPMMGWSTWNLLHQNISEKIVFEVAESIKNNGLLAAGYRYINLDDCWQASVRDNDMRLQFDIGRFPNKNRIVDKLNALGFRAGIYSSCGNYTCEDMPGSYGFEDIDAKTFAEWGFEFLKYDYCHVMDLPTDPHYEHFGFANHTPPILYVAISGLGSNGYEKVLHSNTAEVIAPAYFEGQAIYKIHCTRAAATFEMHIPQDGQYQLAIGYIKEESVSKRFLLTSINGVPDAQIWFPPTSGWCSPARVTATVQLKAGKNTLMLTNPIRGQREDSMLRYIRMGKALRNATLHKKPIYYSICEHGRTKPWTWANEVASSWRVSGDISDNWEAVVRNYEIAEDLWEYQQPGTYNDPDMLEVGVGNLTDIENQTHFVLWCMLAAPLVLGLDVRNASEKTLRLIADPELIAINQDELLLQAARIKLRDGLDLLIKPLIHKRCAICLFNKSDMPISNISVSVDTLLTNKRVQLDISDDMFVIDVLNERTRFKLRKTLDIQEIQPHGVALLTLDPHG